MKKGDTWWCDPPCYSIYIIIPLHHNGLYMYIYIYIYVAYLFICVFWVEVPLQPPIIHHFAIFCRAYPLHCLEPFVLRQLVAAVIIQLLPGERQFLAKGVDQELHEFLAQKKAGFAKRSQNEWRWSNDPMDEEEWVGDPWYTFIYFQHLYIPKGNEIKSNRLIISLLNSSGRLERLWLLQLPIRIPMCKNCGLWSASTWETVAVQRLSVRRLDYHVFARIPRIHTPSEPECWEQTSWPGSLLWDKEGCYCCNCTTLGIHQLGKHKRTHTIYLLPITILATICCNGSYMFLSWKAKSCVCVCGTNLAIKGITDITISHWFLCLLNCRAISLSNFL